MLPSAEFEVSGERFSVNYHIWGSESDVTSIADDICVEQTIEFPADLVADDDIRRHVIGRRESIRELGDGKWEAVISYAIETTGFALPQLINVVFGNISMKPNMRVDKLTLPQSLLDKFNGPRFGRDGLRSLLGVNNRALFLTALKPMGLSSKQLALQAYQFAKGGTDLIKDDHGLANQPFAPYSERVERCAEAVTKANLETGYQCKYVPSLSSPMETIVDDAIFAKECGAGGLLIAPGLVGFDCMRAIADNDDIALPIIAHPSFIGTYAVAPKCGVSYLTLFGQLMRLAGADISIFPNFGGRFSFTQDQCMEIVLGTEMEIGKNIRPIFPSPGGGMSKDRLTDMVNTYGREVVFLIGGALHRSKDGLTKSCTGLIQRVTELTDQNTQLNAGG